MVQEQGNHSPCAWGDSGFTQPSTLGQQQISRPVYGQVKHGVLLPLNAPLPYSSFQLEISWAKGEVCVGINSQQIYLQETCLAFL